MKNYDTPILLLILVMIVISCTSNDQSEPELIALNVGITPFLGELSSYVAQDQGFFTDEGLDVTLIENRAGIESIHQLFAGEVDVAHASETVLLYALLDSNYYRGPRLGQPEIIASMMLTHRIQKIVARKDHGITNPRDLQNKRIAIAKGSQSDYHLDSFLLEFNMSERDVETIHIPAPQQLDSLRAGTVDAMAVWEPHAMQALQELGDNAVELQGRLITSALWLALSLDTFSSQHPEVLAAYLKALDKAKEYIRENPEYAQELLAAKIDTPRELIKSVWLELDYIVSLGEHMITTINNQKVWFHQKGLANTGAPNTRELINYTPMELALPENIRVIQ